MQCRTLRSNQTAISLIRVEEFLFNVPIIGSFKDPIDLVAARLGSGFAASYLVGQATAADAPLGCKRRTVIG